MDGLGDVVHVLRGDAGDGNASVFRQVHVELFRQTLDLLGLESGEAEHADLVGDVLPGVRVAGALDAGAELAPHRDDPVRHLLYVSEPLLFEFGVGEYLLHEAGAVQRRVGVHDADHDLDLRHHLGGRRLVAAQEGQGARALSVQTHVLSETLRQHDLVSFLDEETDCESVIVDITGGETLIRHVEERE